LNQREKLIFLLPSITSSFDKQKGEVISWSSAGKWVLEVLKEHPYAAQMAAEDCSSSEAGLKKVKVYVKSRKRT
jgi:ribosomal protein S11